MPFDYPIPMPLPRRNPRRPRLVAPGDPVFMQPRISGANADLKTARPSLDVPGTPQEARAQQNRGAGGGLGRLVDNPRVRDYVDSFAGGFEKDASRSGPWTAFGTGFSGAVGRSRDRRSDLAKAEQDREEREYERSRNAARDSRAAARDSRDDRAWDYRLGRDQLEDSRYTEERDYDRLQQIETDIIAFRKQLIEAQPDGVRIPPERLQEIDEATRAERDRRMRELRSGSGAAGASATPVPGEDRPGSGAPAPAAANGRPPQMGPEEAHLDGVGTQDAPYMPLSDEQFNAMPVGSYYIDPDTPNVVSRKTKNIGG